jgi:predicted AlkP superfamily phosphohydrolase/phosphomutase
LQEVDWSRSQIYAVGLNSLYVNLEKREGKGCVPLDIYAKLLEDVSKRLTAWLGLDGRPVVQRVLSRSEAFSGPLADHGPDLVIGFSPGYRASADTGLGKWQAVEMEQNIDHWSSDHCIDSTAVPGVIFSNSSLEGLSNPSYRDIPRLAIGKAIEQSYTQPPPPPSITDEESQKIIEERMKGLGYL